MPNKVKPFLLTLAVIFIVGTIWYLEATKPITTPAQSLVVYATTTASTATSTSRAAIIAQKAKQYQPGIELADPTGFINTGPFKLADLVGKKVILIDFWTYSCINCIRTIPYLNAWYAKYKDYGLVIVGIHSPEFDFEKSYDNVNAAVKKFGIQYPVVLDSNHGTWNAYQNQYWPNEYLIDIDGFIVDQHAGEGNYAETEAAIQATLKERAQVLGLNIQIPGGTVSPTSTIAIDFSQVQSPETYFGSNRNQYLGNGAQGATGVQTLTVPSNIAPNTLYLGGTWDFQSEYAENQGMAKVLFDYSAKNVYLVASSQAGATIKILLDGKPLGAEAGADVASDGTAHIQANRLYQLIRGTRYGEHTIEIDVESGSLDAYTFTFG